MPPLLSSSSFQEALSSHINRNKDVDPIARSQIESLTLEWIPERRTVVHQKDGDGCHDENNNHHGYQRDNNRRKSNDSTEEFERVTNTQTTKRGEVEGTLRLSNEYVVLSLHSFCQWELWKPLSTTSPTIAGSVNTTSSSTEEVNDQYGGSIGTTRNTTKVHGTMTFRLNASVALKQQVKNDGGDGNDKDRNQNQNKNSNTATNVLDRKEQRRRDKIRKGMQKRMKDDAYIRCLMEDEGKRGRVLQNVTSGPPTRTNDEETFGPLLFEGSVRQGRAPSDDDFGLVTTVIDPNRLEERVYVSDGVLEGVRRSLFSSLTTKHDNGGDGDDETNDDSERHGTVAVVQLLLDMPYIPRRNPSLDLDSSSRNKDVDNNEMVGTNYLAERVALRLLEDATLDACEKEEEEEMLNDLTLSDGVIVTTINAGENNTNEKAGRKEVVTESRKEHWSQLPIRKKCRMRKH